MTARETKAKYFNSGGEFRAWLESNHDRATELLLGFYKKSAGEKGITYPDALDEALAFGWIDGVRRGVDEERYTIRSRRARREASGATWADRAALAFHEKQPPAYRRLVAHWVMRAKKPETRARRLQIFIANAREGKRIPSQLSRASKACHPDASASERRTCSFNAGYGRAASRSSGRWRGHQDDIVTISARRS